MTITINEALTWLKTLRERHTELVGLRNENSAVVTRRYGVGGDKETERKPTYEVKTLDKLVTTVAREIQSLEQAIKVTNATTTVTGYDRRTRRSWARSCSSPVTGETATERTAQWLHRAPRKSTTRPLLRQHWACNPNQLAHNESLVGRWWLSLDCPCRWSLVVNRAVAGVVSPTKRGARWRRTESSCRSRSGYLPPRRAIACAADACRSSRLRAGRRGCSVRARVTKPRA